MHRPLSIVIPTYGRDKVLVETLDGLLRLEDRAEEILVIDQSKEHDRRTNEHLERWHQTGEIRWIRRREPSITAAMNAGLQAARGQLVLFLDDDLIPGTNLCRGHQAAFAARPEMWASVGQVIQPWQRPESLVPPRLACGLRKDFDFPFHSLQAAKVSNVMAGNLCVDREKAISIGGFDERFLGTAYRFETDFARRLLAAGGAIWFTPAARIDHLRVARGGTRQQGNHLASPDPRHGVGDYYYAFRHGRRWEATRYAMWRFVREFTTRYHARHPWAIPVKAWGELRAWVWGWRLARRGPRLMVGKASADRPSAVAGVDS